VRAAEFPQTNGSPQKFPGVKPYIDQRGKNLPLLKPDGEDPLHRLSNRSIPLETPTIQTSKSNFRSWVNEVWLVIVNDISFGTHFLFGRALVKLNRRPSLIRCRRSVVFHILVPPCKIAVLQIPRHDHRALMPASSGPLP
jgi:hypothetical protein